MTARGADNSGTTQTSLEFCSVSSPRRCLRPAFLFLGLRCWRCQVESLDVALSGRVGVTSPSWVLGWAASPLRTWKEGPASPAAWCCPQEKGQGPAPTPPQVRPCLPHRGSGRLREALSGNTGTFALPPPTWKRAARLEGAWFAGLRPASSWSGTWASLCGSFSSLSSMCHLGNIYRMAEGRLALSPRSRLLPRLSVTLPFKTSSWRGTCPVFSRFAPQMPPFRSQPIYFKFQDL